jgi:hypothetical protein
MFVFPETFPKQAQRKIDHSAVGLNSIALAPDGKQMLFGIRGRAVRC